MYNILVLEDDKDLNSILTNILKTAGYNVFSTFNGFDAMDVFNEEKIDTIITDLVLPIMPGERFIKEIRKISDVHILVISAKISLQEKLEGLKVGADDYLTKPFSPEEVIMKLSNYFKKLQRNRIISLNDRHLVFEESKVELLLNGVTIELTGIEYSMLKFMLYRVNSVVTREQILNNVFYQDKAVTTRVVDSHIKNIRRKMNNVTDKEYIKTIYGLGYSIVGKKDEQ